MPTHTFSKGWNNGTASLSEGVSISSSAELSFDFALTASQVDKQYDIDFVRTRLKGIFIECDRDITIETNAATAVGGNTLLVNGGEGYMWTYLDAAPNPFTADVASMFITNNEALAATGRVRVLYDAAV